MLSPITITNFHDDEVLTYPLAIIRGTTVLPALYISTPTPSKPPTSVPLIASHFTALYHLRPGLNNIHFTSAATTPCHTQILTLSYHPPAQTPPYVRLVYVLAADTDGTFPSPSPPCTLSSALDRLRTAGLMIQSATADMLHAQGLSRRTFRLHPDILVHRLHDLPLSRALDLPDLELWSQISSSLASQPNRADTIDLAVMSFTRVIDGRVRAHTALGGGPLALFGGGSLFTWPTSVADIVLRLRDVRQFDATKWFDDSAGRAASMGRRASTATTIGACLHELGHCLSLPHPTADAERNGGGIMARGFDQFAKLFMESDEIGPLPFWDRGSAVRLRYHRFLQFEAEGAMRTLRSEARCRRWPMPTPTPAPRVPGQGKGPVFEKREDGTVLCRAEQGIGHVGYYKNGDNAAHEEFGDEEPTLFHVPEMTQLRRKCRASASDKITLSAIDSDGRIVDTPYDTL